jgi:hypothetical protein
LTPPLSRRRLLRAAGGAALFAATGGDSAGRLFAAAPGTAKTARPIFTALPYLQPGADGGPFRAGQAADSLVVAWQTNAVTADFTLVGPDGAARVVRASRFSGDKEDGEGVYNYAATVGGLARNGKRAPYRLVLDGKTVFTGELAGRKGRGQKTRFVVFGDNSYGDISDRMIAHQVYLARPDFVMNTGDVVYEGGLDNEYARYFFPVYNADVAAPRVGAPLLRSVPFYAVIANHDVHDKDAQKHPVADFAANPDSLAYFTNFYLPTNGPAALAHAPPAVGDADAVASFKAAAGARYPNQANYSFDYGDAHFLCLDSNVYVDPSDAALQAWIRADLTATDAAWKFVVYHHPAFNAGAEHYAEQHMRVLSPLFEQAGVAVVLHGHEHNYQRTRPLRFAPKDPAAASAVNEKKRLVPGAFAVDRKFDGATETRPDGILYVTTGAGGKHLYDTDWNRRPDLWRHKEDDSADYVAAFVSDRHSLTVFDMDARSLTLTQVDQWGAVVDRCRITKG